jgi:hypothetical protein
MLAKFVPQGLQPPRPRLCIPSIRRSRASLVSAAATCNRRPPLYLLTENIYQHRERKRERRERETRSRVEEGLTLAKKGDGIRWSAPAMGGGRRPRRAIVHPLPCTELTRHRLPAVGRHGSRRPRPARCLPPVSRPRFCLLPPRCRQRFRPWKEYLREEAAEHETGKRDGEWLVECRYFRYREI